MDEPNRLLSEGFVHSVNSLAAPIRFAKRGQANGPRNATFRGTNA